jgi:hypothetical protein
MTRATLTPGVAGPDGLVLARPRCDPPRLIDDEKHPAGRRRRSLAEEGPANAASFTWPRTTEWTTAFYHEVLTS